MSTDSEPPKEAIEEPVSPPSPLVHKLLEKGIISRHAAQMLERWGGLPRGAHTLAPDDDTQEQMSQEVTEKSLQEFAEEIEQLLTPAERGKATTVLD